MLIFTYKLEKYIKQQLLPKILLDSNKSKYAIKGSFRRRIPYVTDIDIINNVYPEINRSNVYSATVSKIKQVLKDKSIILYMITCGTDERFKIVDDSEKQIQQVKTLLNETESAQLTAIVEKYSYNKDKMVFFINELVWEHYKIRWNVNEVLQNKKILPGNKIVKFTDCVNETTTLLFQYFVHIDQYPIGVDMVVNYEPVQNVEKIYENAANYLIKLANYSKEYYYMLFPFRHYFKNNKQIRQQLEDIIEKKYGLYKQLMVRIDSYHTMYDNGVLTPQLAKKIVVGIIKDVVKLPGFNSNIVEKIKKIIDDDNSSNIQSDTQSDTRSDSQSESEHSSGSESEFNFTNTDIETVTDTNYTDNDKIKQWYLLLDILYDEINMDVNTRSQKYFYKFLAMLPEDLKSSYLLANDYRKNIPLKYSK